MGGLGHCQIPSTARVPSLFVLEMNEQSGSPGHVGGRPLSSFSLLLLLSLSFLPLPLSIIVMFIEPPLRLCLRPGGKRRPGWKEPHEVSSSRIRSGLTRFNCCLSQRPCNPTVGHDLRSQETVLLIDFQGSKYISPLGIPALGSPSPL